MKVLSLKVSPIASRVNRGKTSVDLTVVCAELDSHLGTGEQKTVRVFLHKYNQIKGCKWIISFNGPRLFVACVAPDLLNISDMGEVLPQALSFNHEVVAVSIDAKLEIPDGLQFRDPDPKKNLIMAFTADQDSTRTRWASGDKRGASRPRIRAVKKPRKKEPKPSTDSERFA